MTTQELKVKIEKQKANNIKLFNSIPLATHKDPRNNGAESILIEWRKGSEILRQLIKELQEKGFQKSESIGKKVFVNSFGEATKREITTTAYKVSQRKLEKELMMFCGK